MAHHTGHTKHLLGYLLVCLLLAQVNCQTADPPSNSTDSNSTNITTIQNTTDVYGNGSVTANSSNNSSLSFSNATNFTLGNTSENSPGNSNYSMSFDYLFFPHSLGDNF